MKEYKEGKGDYYLAEGKKDYKGEYTYTISVKEHMYMPTYYVETGFDSTGHCGYLHCIWPKDHPIHIQDSSWPTQWTKKNTKVETGWICPICNKPMVPEVDDVAFSYVLDATVHADCLVDSM